MCIPETRDAFDAAWLTAAFQESGLLTVGQQVARVKLVFDILGGNSGDGVLLFRVQLEYSGEGDLHALPKSAVIKCTDILTDMKGKGSDSRLVLLRRVAYGLHSLDDVQREHMMYRFLASDRVKEQAWALKSPAIYFEATEHMPTERPSWLAILLFGAWMGSASPRARSMLIMEDLRAKGLRGAPARPLGGNSSEWLCRLELPELKRLLLEPMARWHAAHWGCRDPAARLLPASARVVAERAKDMWALSYWRESWAGLMRLRLRRTASGPCPFADAVAAALEEVYRPGDFAALVRALDRPGTMVALRGLERSYGPLLVHHIRNRLVDGDAAVRNRTVIHGDMHFFNTFLRHPREAGQGDAAYANPHFFDFQKSGRGHAVQELLKSLVINFESWRPVPAQPVLEAYYATLSAALPRSVEYSRGDFLEDWSLAVVELACESLVLLSLPQLALGLDAVKRRSVARSIALLEEVWRSETKVGGVLMKASEGQHLREASEAAFRAEREASDSASEAIACLTEGCPYAVTWHPTHCCTACSDSAGRRHGPRCERLDLGCAGPGEPPASGRSGEPPPAAREEIRAAADEQPASRAGEPTPVEAGRHVGGTASGAGGSEPTGSAGPPARAEAVGGSAGPAACAEASRAGSGRTGGAGGGESAGRAGSSVAAAAKGGGEATEAGGVRSCRTAGCRFQATWHPTLCCAACEHGMHGPRCEKKAYCLPASAPAASDG